MAKHEAVMTLPKNGSQLWTAYMQAEKKAPDGVYPNEPIVLSRAEFGDGVVVVAGVLNSGVADYNIKFAWVFDRDGNRVPNVLDVSDHEDFSLGTFEFTIDDEINTYAVKLVEDDGKAREKKEKETAAKAAVIPAATKIPPVNDGAPVVVCFGQAFWHELPEGRVLGGMAANTAWAAAQLGADARIVSAVGDDAAGRDFVAALAARGFSTDGIAVVPGAATAVSKTKIDKKGNAGVKLKENAPWDAFAATAAAGEWAKQADAICFDSTFPAADAGRAAWRTYLDSVRPAALKLFDVKMEKGKVDAGLVKDGVFRSNLFKYKEDEVKLLLTACELDIDPENMGLLYMTIKKAGNLWGLGITARRGMIFINEQLTFEESRPPEHVVNSIGAGDAIFAGMVFAGLRKTKKPLVSLVTMAGLACGVADGMPGLPEELGSSF